MKPPKRILIVDGYNVINARRQVAGAQALADARDALVSELQNYAGYSGQRIILVFDAWMNGRTQESVEETANVQVVYTQKGEIADRYIERLCDELAEDVSLRRAEVRVATSDALEQTIVLGRGATRISSRELLREMQEVRTGSRALQEPKKHRATVGERLDPEVLRRLRGIGEDD